jgi:hypothetical protein
MIDATQVQGARVLGISPSPDGKVTEIDFYIPASKQILVLHVAAVPSGMSADLKSYSFYYEAGVSGALDNILVSTLQAA